jgi:hypothetical protein
MIGPGLEQLGSLYHPIGHKEDRTDTSGYGLAAKEMHNQRNRCEQQQEMNQSTGYVENQKAAQPRKQ